MQKEFMLKEIEMLIGERDRRSRQQFEYIRLNLINIGVLSLFAVFKLFDSDSQISFDYQEHSIFIFSIMAVLSVISITLFLLWIDDALTIGAIDRFLDRKEQSLDHEGDVYWFEYRRQVNKSGAFMAKKWIFNIAILFSFVFPPFLFAIFGALHTVLTIPIWVQIAGGLSFFIILIIPMIVWRRFTKRLYG